MDNEELRRGEKISPALEKAIEESKISIIIFSENYASSTWCLDELMKILECKESKQHKVLPVFYKVEPSTVRHQNSSFKEALAKHEEKFKDDAKVQRWKTALKQAADLSGLHLKINENESEFIQKIVQEVSKVVLNRTYLHVAEYPVGINSPVEDINMLLCIKENDKRMIGIFGIGGIGKTTIAKEIYNRITDQFEGSCFLANVRESSKQDQGGLVKLQQTILYEILKDSSWKVGNVDRGINLIKKRLCCKKILLILDDVDHLEQLEKLCGRCDWFGSGSRIIITTRDEGLLTKHHVHFKYRLKEMDHHEALQLFSRHAFKSHKPDDAFADVIKLALKYAGSLPLALKVIGSNLYGEDIHYWKSELKKYKRIPEENIHEKLKISYDGLDYHTKKIFLDIACFFKGDEREYVTKILDSCGFFAYAGIKKLNDKCLIMIDQHNDDQYLLWMHDLLEDMGKEIVRQESPEEPGKRSRLYFHEDVREVFEKNKGTEKIEGILIDLPQEDCKTQFSTKAFAKLKNLRIFINCNASFRGKLKYLSNELRVLVWPLCPLEILPSYFHGGKLIVLNIRRSNIRDLGTGLQSKNLTSIDCSGSKYLTKISDLSSCSNLKKLILDECKNLVEVHDSVGFLDKLVELKFEQCSSLKNLPRSFKLRSLKLLELGGCTSLENFPEIECEMEHLKYVMLESTVIQELPSSITYLAGLEELLMYGCKNLVHLPINIFQFEHLEKVYLLYCPNFLNFGKEVGHNGQSMLCTQENEISSSMKLFPLPPSESNFSLTTLNLSSSGIVSLPPCIERFVGLARLSLRDCKQLEKILHLPPNIEEVDATGCGLLERFHNVSTESSFGIPNLKWLTSINLSECNKMHVNVGNHAPDPLWVQECFQMKDSSRIIYPGSRIPEWFKYCKETTSYSNSIEIEIDHTASMCFGHQMVALVLCFVVGPLPLGYETITISINSQLMVWDPYCDLLWPSMDPHRVCLKYIAGNSIDEMMLRSYRKGNNMRFIFGSGSKEAILKSVGVHLIYRNDNFINPIQLSKRYRDGGEHDLESTTKVAIFNHEN
ncbi:disease resistance protein Roq1-like [Juglans microcarpa x Juglans regia]|uniref:disease resistance protein Roq1-like n=1 Tax=Juglans microcarpa x Juglans regia TaxID=2249226 RepID=UPI001B7F0456|nr:disease resistance protein Roq1-like [Juglans microcarpa x Juglans regia]